MLKLLRMMLLAFVSLSLAGTYASAQAKSAKEISDAKAKGMVWVNTDSKIYHKDGRYYGNTKQGQFMTEADAQKAGYRAAKSEIGEKGSSKSAPATAAAPATTATPAATDDSTKKKKKKKTSDDGGK